MTTMTKRKKLCPVCGEKISQRDTTRDGRIIGSCGDAFYATTDIKGRTTWHNRRPSNYVRNDLWAVLEYQDTGHKSNWVMVRVYRSEASANRYAEDTNQDLRRPFPLVKAKIRHPQSWEVDGFVAVGNQIEN